LDSVTSLFEIGHVIFTDQNKMQYHKDWRLVIGRIKYCRVLVIKKKSLCQHITMPYKVCYSNNFWDIRPDKHGCQIWQDQHCPHSWVSQSLIESNCSYLYNVDINIS
jgi:hypothetical protein